MKLYLSGRILETFDPRPGLEEFVSLAKETGYDGVGLRQWHIPQGREEIDNLKRLLDDAGMDVCSIRTTPELLQQAIEAARALGVKVLRMWDGYVEAAPSLDAGMRVGPQMHTGGEFENVSMAARTLAKIESSKVGVIPEPANLMLAGETWSEGLFAPLAGRIIGCNIQSIAVGQGEGSLTMSDGRTVNYERIPFSENDQADLPGFFSALRAVGYDHYVQMIDVVPENESLKEFAAECAKSLQPLM